MANNQRFSITFDASLNVSQIKGALNDIQKGLNNLHLPQNATKGLQGTFSKLSEEIQKFEVAAGKEIGSKADFSKIEKSAAKIGELFGTLKRQVSELTGKSGKELEKLFPEDITKKITNATNALNTYKEATNAAKQAMANAAKEVDKFNKKLSNEQKKTPVSDAKYKKIVEENKEANEELNRLEQEREALVQKHEALEARLQKQGKNPGKVYKEQEQAIQDLNKAIEEQRDLVKQTAETKASSATFDQQAKNIANFSAKLEEAKEKLKTTKEILDRLESNGAEGGLTKLRDEIGRLTGLDMSKFETSIKGVEEAIQSLSSDQLEKLRQGFSLVDNAMGNSETEVQTLGKKLQELGNEVTSADSKMREVDALKSRIQYFFGLNNAIELVKRTIRSAFETVKELDKAMTETAVVTDFSVADMWAQLPDYTKRANDLGVTTKAAYEAATLYYQQGLKTNEVTAMSNETLKMARIAGLDAAVATDRMTNAIRGFNMEINEMNAQRIDDVYSKLAAISASNVDEISTAMTKVASLANNANMEFETTSAFLAQIIETTRESAETAGTALKTVVARFSEVKKLVSEGQLKGQDSEGEGIDVNKVQAALRTAGVDLRRYFLGEVGLDDIFMELASKWDSLTTLQQRYIATQAAGSRQQSRFIALMSDYGRMQELVGEAYNANGAAAEQFGKTQDSLQSKLAKLKNAWDEFAMGIANSNLIKAGVSFLTWLLNSVNKLTEGFGLLTGSVGEFISSILKLTVLIGTLKLGKGLLAGGISGLGGLWRGENFAEAAMKTMGNFGKGKGLFSLLFGGLGKTAARTAGTAAAGAAGAASAAGAAGGLVPAAGGALAASGGAGALSALGAGAASLLPVLGGIIVALGVIRASYKVWEEMTPWGQLHASKKLAEQLSEEASAAKKTAQAYEDVQDRYQEYTDNLNAAKTVEERNKVIQDQNDYLRSIMDEDATYSKYISSKTLEDGQIILTLDENAFKNALEEKSKEASEAQAKSYFAEADVQTKTANLPFIYFGKNDPDAYNAAKIEHEQAKRAAIEAAAAQARLGYQSQLVSMGKDSQFIDSLSNALGQVYEKSGQISEDNLEKIYDKFSSGDKTASNIISALTGESTANTNLLNIKNDDQLRRLMGLDFTSKEFKEFATFLNISTNELRDFAMNAAKANREVQQNNRNRLQKAFDRHNVPEGYAQDFFNRATPEIQASVADIYDSIEGMVQESEYNNLLEPLLDPEASIDDLNEIKLLIDSISLDDPITGFFQLQDAIGSTNWKVQEFGKSILNSNKSLFNTGNLVKTGLTSDYDENFTKAVNKLLKKNGRIATEDLSELTSGSENLQRLLQGGVISGRTLAKVLTLIGKGKIGFNDINSSLLSVIDNTYTLRDVAEDVHSFIANFDEGLDFGEGIDFAQEKLKELQELINNFEYGNERTSRLWNAFFGEDYEYAWAEGEDYIKTRVQELAKWVENDGYGFFSDANIMSALGITNQGGGRLDWDLSNFKNVDDLIAKMQRAGRVSREGAQILLESFASHADYDWKKQFDDLSLQGALDNIIEQFENGKTFWSEEELQKIADAYGITLDQLKQKLEEKNEQFSLNLYNNKNPLFGSKLFEKFQEDLTLSGKTFEDFISQFLDETGLKIESFKNALSQMGYSELQIDDIVSQLNKALEKLNLDDYFGKNGKGQIQFLQDFISTLQEAQNIQITDHTTGLPTDKKNVVPLSREEVEKQLQQYSDGGNVDLTLRPVINAKDLNKAGYEAAEGIATTFTHTFSDRSGTLAMNFTPIMTDGKGNAIGVLSPEEFEKYCKEVVAGIHDDYLNLQIGTEFTGTNAVITGDQVADIEHQLQEAYYLPGQALTKGISDNIPKASAETMAMAKQTAQSLYEQIVNGTLKAGEVGSIGFGNALDSAVGRANLYNILANKLKSAGGDAANQIKALLDALLKNLKVTITPTIVKPSQALPTVPVGNGQYSSNTRSYGTDAAGGYILNPLNALTGEEGPEIVWNKEKGYSYITGQTGPEFRRLQSGDQVFTAPETKDILRRSKNINFFTSHAGGGGRWNIGSGTSGSTKQSSSSSSSEKTSDEWKNELDWLYNLMEDIAESERTQEKLAKQHERYLKDATKTGKDLYNITKQQMQNLNQQYAYQKQALAGREKEMQEQINQSGYTDYIWWNNNDRTIEINWDKIESLQDKDTYDKVSELVSKAEDIQSKIDAAEDALRDIEGQMGELQERYIQEYIDFEQTVLQAVVGKYQETIDELSSLDDTLNKANDNILNSIRKEIDLQRQIRDNTDTENNINDMETRLAYLRRDTTGANQNEILQLEKQIREARQGYSDTLVDQSLDKLSEANEEASEQRQHQIQLLTEQLEYWQNSGALWTEVQSLMQESLDKGYLVVDSKLVDLIKLTEEYQKMSPVQQAKFIKDLEISFKDVIAFYQNQQHPNYNPSTNYMDDILKLVAQRGSDVWDSEEFNDLLKNRNEKYIAEGWGTEEDLANEMAALHKLTDTPWAPYQKVNFDPNTDYMAIMNALLEKYGSGAVNTKEWKDAAAARESKMVEEARAKGEDVEAAIAKARFQQAILENKASKLEDYSQIKWDDNIDYKAEMLKIIEKLGVEALTDPTYLEYAAAREQKIVEKGLGTREQARAEQAEINDLAIQAGTEAEINELMQEILDSIYKGIGNTPIFNKNGGYATGGLTTKTGLAWLDGTPSEPEYVLNARQTDAFLRLAEVLPSALGRSSSLTNTIGGNVYLELTMNVGEIGSDYDVDRLVDRVKQDIYDASAYRNINVISSIR